MGLDLIYTLKNFLGIELISHVVFASGVQCSDSVILTRIPSLFKTLSHRVLQSIV